MATNQKITICLWFNPGVSGAEEAAEFYTGVFKNSQITATVLNTSDSRSGKEGSVLTVGFSLEGLSFVGLNGGPEFQFNPSISMMVNCKTEKEVDELWNKLSERKTDVLMPLDKYPFSQKYGWLKDKYGLTWQIILTGAEIKQKIVPSLMFVNKSFGKAEEAMQFYMSLFQEAKAGSIFRYRDFEPDKGNAVAYGDFTLLNQWFSAMDGAGEHAFTFNEAVSFVVNCDTQKEIDTYWEKLSAVPQAEMCGWLKDKYGVSWQIVPADLQEFLQHNDAAKSKRVFEALMKMKKLDIAALKNA